MTDMQTSLPLLIVRPSILNPIMHFSTQPLTGEMKCHTSHTFALRISISSPFINSILQMLMQPMNQHNHEWYDPIHIITRPLWSINLDLARSSPLPRSIGAKSCPSFTASRSIASKPWLALLHCNRSIKPSLVLIFTTLVTWLYVMTHIQWAPSHAD